VPAYAARDELHVDASPSGPKAVRAEGLRHRRARCSICALAVCLTRPLSKPPPPVANEIAASLACGRRMMEPAAGVLPWGCQRQVGKPVRARGGRRPPALRRRGRCPCRKAEWPIFEW